MTKHDEDRCPKCGSLSVLPYAATCEWDAPWLNGRAEVGCLECDATWVSIYEVTFYRIADEEEGA